MAQADNAEKKQQDKESKKSQIKLLKNEDKSKYSDWSTWSKEKSKFDWTYDSKETCYIIKGKVTVTAKNGGDAVTFGPGDVVIFEKGLECVWEIHEDVEKYYNFS
eukprot:777859_1